MKLLPSLCTLTPSATKPIAQEISLYSQQATILLDYPTANTEYGKTSAIVFYSQNRSDRCTHGVLVETQHTLFITFIVGGYGSRRELSMFY